jgi:putative spermidine/putrescine transport system substrate-binding protein
MINLFSTGEVSAAVAQDFTLGQIQAAVPSVKWADLAEGSIATLNTVNIPTGAAEPDLAYEFINFILSQEIQQQLAEQGVDAPVNTAVDLTPEQAALWTYGADLIAGLQRIDYAKMNAAKGGWVDRWNEIFGM